jgi:Fe2+ or Zn2+ uptake regulation protein
LLQQLERDVEHRLGAHGVRFTRGRRRVLAAVSAADGPLAASQIHAAVKTVPLSSLYRSLAVLVDAGVLAPHHAGDGTTRYELAEWLTGHHHHLVCVSCGTVSDVGASAEHEEVVDRLVEAFAVAGDFAVSGHRFEIEGRCSSCR